MLKPLKRMVMNFSGITSYEYGVEAYSREARTSPEWVIRNNHSEPSRHTMCPALVLGSRTLCCFGIIKWDTSDEI